MRKGSRGRERSNYPVWHGRRNTLDIAGGEEGGTPTSERERDRDVCQSIFFLFRRILLLPSPDARAPSSSPGGPIGHPLPAASREGGGPPQDRLRGLSPGSWCSYSRRGRRRRRSVVRDRWRRRRRQARGPSVPLPLQPLPGISLGGVAATDHQGEAAAIRTRSVNSNNCANI